MIPKIMVLAIAGGDKRHAKMEAACRDTWARERPGGVNVLFVKGRSGQLERRALGLLRRMNTRFKICTRMSMIIGLMVRVLSNAMVRIEDDACRVNVPDSWFLLSIKTIRSFAYLLDISDFDYIFRTNVSSYIDLEMLQRFVAKLEPKNLYLAKKMIYRGDNEYQGLIYGSGAGFCISRDVVIRLVKDQNLIIREQLEKCGTLIDDMQFGEVIINRYGVQLVEGVRYDIDAGGLREDDVQVNTVDDQYHYYFTGDKSSECHYRLHKFVLGRRRDWRKSY